MMKTFIAGVLALLMGMTVATYQIGLPSMLASEQGAIVAAAE